MHKLMIGALAISGATLMLAAHPAPTVGPIRAAGDTVTVQMIGSSSGYSFQPSTVRIKVGQSVKFVTVSSGPPVTNPDDSYTITFKGAKPGTYKFYCLPHQSLGMQGTIIVE